MFPIMLFLAFKWTVYLNLFVRGRVLVDLGIRLRENNVNDLILLLCHSFAYK